MLSNLSSPWSRILGVLFSFAAFEVWILPNFQKRFLVFPYELANCAQTIMIPGRMENPWHCVAFPILRGYNKFILYICKRGNNYEKSMDHDLRIQHTPAAWRLLFFSRLGRSKLYRTKNLFQVRKNRGRTSGTSLGRGHLRKAQNLCILR